MVYKLCGIYINNLYNYLPDALQDPPSRGHRTSWDLSSVSVGRSLYRDRTKDLSGSWSVSVTTFGRQPER